jgi:Protein of unknown function (DUF2442)
MREPVRVRAVEALDGFKVRLEFEDGTHKVIDLESFLWGPIFEPIRKNQPIFRSVHIIGGTIAWENGADIDPDVLYYDLKAAWMEEQTSVH